MLSTEHNDNLPSSQQAHRAVTDNNNAITEMWRQNPQGSPNDMESYSEIDLQCQSFRKCLTNLTPCKIFSSQDHKQIVLDCLIKARNKNDSHLLHLIKVLQIDCIHMLTVLKFLNLRSFEVQQVTERHFSQVVEQQRRYGILCEEKEGLLLK